MQEDASCPQIKNTSINTSLQCTETDKQAVYIDPTGYKTYSDWLTLIVRLLGSITTGRVQ